MNDASGHDLAAREPIEQPGFAQQLKDCGLQVTAQRLAIMRAVSVSPHLTADELTEIVRDNLGSISRQAVYDTLAALADHQLVRRIQPAGSPTRYEDRVGDNHHHLVCRGCGLIFDIDCAVGSAPCLEVEHDQGFEIDEAEVVYWGRCPTCRPNEPVSREFRPNTRRSQAT